MVGKKLDKKQLKKSGARQNDTKLSNETPFQVAEAYKILRTNLLFALAAGKNKVMVVSSALPSEGKSATCANLAITVAQTGARVIIVDADLRKPTQYQIFKCNNSKGLTTILAGFNNLDEVIKKEVEPNLDIITSGPTPPNPSELLGTERMSHLIEKLVEHYEYVFIDTPPINVVTDAMVLANKTAGVVLVARHGQSTYDNFTKAISSIEFSGANILGVVINAVSEKSGRYGKYGKYKYSYSRK